MEHIQGYVWAIATVAAMLSSMVMAFLVHVGLLVGILLALLALFVRALRAAALYLLLTSFCAVLVAWSVFQEVLNAVGRRLEYDRIFQVMTIGPFAGFTVGGLLGGGLGFLLARILVRWLRRSTIQRTPPPVVSAPQSQS